MRIRDLGSGMERVRIRDPDGKKSDPESGIRDKHNASATQYSKATYVIHDFKKTKRTTGTYILQYSDIKYRYSVRETTPGFNCLGCRLVPDSN